MTTGRTGSDYLQCCLDGIPGILTLTGQTYFKKFFSDSKFNSIKHDQNKVINKFLNDYINLFDKDPLENKIIKINKSNFKKKFLNNVKKIELNKKKFY